MMSTFLAYCLILFCHSCGVDGVLPTWNNTDELLKSLLRNNNKLVRPIEDHTMAIQVNISFSLIALNDIDEVGGTMSFSSFIYVYWKDEKMTWNASSNGVYAVVVPFDDVWTPNLVITNPSEEMKKLGDDFTHVRYFPDGTALWQPPIIMSTACEIDITYYPFDMQTCEIFIMSWMSIRSEVRLATPLKDAGMQYFRANGEWEVEHVTHSVYEDGEYLSMVVVELALRRKPIFLILNIVLPIVFLGAINSLVFILPVECGERVSYAITVLLSFAVFMVLVSDRVPGTSEPQSIMSVYLAIMLGYSVLIMFLAILSLRMHFGKDNRPVPVYVRKLLMVLTCGACCKHRRAETADRGPDRDIPEPAKNYLSTDKHGSNRRENIAYLSDSIEEDIPFADWKHVASTVDTILFVISLLVFIVVSVVFLISLATHKEL